MAQISIFRQPSQAVQYELSGCLNVLSLSQTKPTPHAQSHQQSVERVLTMWELFRRQLQGTPEDYKPALKQDAGGSCPVRCCESELGSSQVTTPTKHGCNQPVGGKRHKILQLWTVTRTWGSERRYFPPRVIMHWTAFLGTWQIPQFPVIISRFHMTVLFRHITFSQQLLSSFAEHKRIRIYCFISPFVWHPSRCSFIAQQAQGHARSFSPAMPGGTNRWRNGRKKNQF